MTSINLIGLQGRNQIRISRLCPPRFHSISFRETTKGVSCKQLYRLNGIHAHKYQYKRKGIANAKKNKDAPPRRVLSLSAKIKH